jgi:hypothetical protein
VTSKRNFSKAAKSPTLKIGLLEAKKYEHTSARVCVYFYGLATRIKEFSARIVGGEEVSEAPFSRNFTDCFFELAAWKG